MNGVVAAALARCGGVGAQLIAPVFALLPRGRNQLRPYGRVFIFCWLFVGSAQAADVFDHPQTAQQLLTGPLSQPTAGLRGAQVMRGKFVYKKFLREIPQPLISRGDFVFARDLGIDWHTREPFDSDFVLTAQGMTQRDDGKTTLQMSAAEQPAVKIVARIFLALLSLDVKSLQDSFSLYGIRQDQQWQVGMRPTVPAVAAVFKEAVVSGGAQVDTLVLHDANGDRTEIAFGDLQYDKHIAPAERALFGDRP